MENNQTLLPQFVLVFGCVTQNKIKKKTLVKTNKIFILTFANSYVSRQGGQTTGMRGSDTSEYTDQGRYTIPLHEFIRAVIYGNNKHFDPESSYIVNLFDVNYEDKREHFLILILLSILNSKVTSGKDKGFAETVKVSNHLQGLNFTIDQVDTSINQAINKKLIETSQRGVAISTDRLPSSLRITTTGAYHLNYLCSQFTYIDAIIVDTPVFDDSSRQEIQDTFNISERIGRAKIFIDYLAQVAFYKPLIISTQSRNHLIVNDLSFETIFRTSHIIRHLCS